MPATPHTPGSNGSNKLSSSPSQQPPPMPPLSCGPMNNNCIGPNMYNNMNSYGQHHSAMHHQQQQQNMMADYLSQSYPDPNEFGNVGGGDFGGLRQDFSLDDLNFDPAYMMDNNCSDDLAVISYLKPILKVHLHVRFTYAFQP